MDKTYYTVYKITNNLNDKIYIGVHKTSNLEDGYMGSGKHLKHAQEKYGIENFTKEILKVFDTPEEMFEMESEIVNEEFVSNKETYNLKLGGYGGFDHINDGSDEYIKRQKEFNKKGNKILKELYKDVTSKWYMDRSRKISNSTRFRFETGQMNKFLEAGKTSFSGKPHSDESKKKIGEANSINQMGENNSMFGTMWIHSLGLKESKRIPKGDEIPEGWLKGRKIKY